MIYICNHSNYQNRSGINLQLLSTYFQPNKCILGWARQCLALLAELPWLFISPHHFSEKELLLVGIAIADISKVFLWVGSWHIGSFYPSCKSPRSEPKSHHSNKTNKKWTQHSDQIPLVSQWNVILVLSKKIVLKGVQYKGQYKL